MFEYHAHCVRRFFRQIFVVFRIDTFFQPAGAECGGRPFGEAVISADGDVFVVFADGAFTVGKADLRFEIADFI